jgi:hypothetical protein
MVDAEVKGETYTPKQIKSLPSQLQKWLENNSDRLTVANNRGTLPFWLKDNAKFAGMKINPINTPAQQEIRKAAAEKYNSYGNEWTKAYFDRYSGGYNVYHKDHKFTKEGGGGEAEKIVGEMLAKYNGKQVEFLPEDGKKSPDVRFDNKKWDIKYIDRANENTIRKYLLDARKADNVIFYFREENKLGKLLSAKVREVGRAAKNNKIDELPNMYYMGKNGLLNPLWEKQKGAKKIAPFMLRICGIGHPPAGLVQKLTPALQNYYFSSNHPKIFIKNYDRRFA